jgi:hypothetical protein
MIKPIKRYILWEKSDGPYYFPTEFDSVEEALIRQKFTDDWYLTEALNEVSAYASFRTPPKEQPIASSK